MIDSVFHMMPYIHYLCLGREEGREKVIIRPSNGKTRTRTDQSPLKIRVKPTKKETCKKDILK